MKNERVSDGNRTPDPSIVFPIGQGATCIGIQALGLVLRIIMLCRSMQVAGYIFSADTWCYQVILGLVNSGAQRVEHQNLSEYTLIILSMLY